MNGASRRRPGLTVLSILLFLLSVNAISQGARVALRWDDSPMLLMYLQLLCGAFALAAAIGVWLRLRWAPAVIVLYGVAAGGMVMSLRSILDLPADARTGLILGGMATIAVCLLLAWYARRAIAGEEPNRD